MQHGQNGKRQRMTQPGGEAWRKAWQRASSAGGRIASSALAPEYAACSAMARDVGSRLWKAWHACFGGRYKGTTLLRYDAIELTGETLVHAAVRTLNPIATGAEILSVASALGEFRAAQMIVETRPGAWDVHFGAALTQREIADVREERAALRLKYGSVIRKRPHLTLVR